jgi:hypothetical protein
MKHTNGNLLVVMVVFMVITLIALNAMPAFAKTINDGYETKAPYKTAFGNMNASTNLAMTVFLKT